MDQGFNDDELADIMNEIESLEQEFSDDSKPETVSDNASQQGEEVVSELAHTPSEKVEEAHKAAEDDKNVHKMSHSSDDHYKNATSLDFSVEGDMKMNLFFNISGKTVHVHINQGVFEIELEGGMKFSIPVEENHSLKKVA